MKNIQFFQHLEDLIYIKSKKIIKIIFGINNAAEVRVFP